MSRYNDIPVSNATKKGMTFSSDDIQFLKRMFDRQDEYITEYINDKDARQMHYITQILDEVRKIIKRLDEVDIRLDSLEKRMDIRLAGFEKRIEKLEYNLSNHINESTKEKKQE